MKTEVLFSSANCEWETPNDFFQALNTEFHFDIDVCATEENKKVDRFYSPEQDGLSQPWNGVVWCNPPYGRGIEKWVKKAAKEQRTNADVIVMLIPARTDTRWFHKYVYKKPGVELRFVKGRLKFGGSAVNSPFPSMIVIFHGFKLEV